MEAGPGHHQRVTVRGIRRGIRLGFGEVATLSSAPDLVNGTDRFIAGAFIMVCRSLRACFAHSSRPSSLQRTRLAARWTAGVATKLRSGRPWRPPGRGRWRLSFGKGRTGGQSGASRYPPPAPPKEGSQRALAGVVSPCSTVRRRRAASRRIPEAGRVAVADGAWNLRSKLRKVVPYPAPPTYFASCGRALSYESTIKFPVITEMIAMMTHK